MRPPRISVVVPAFDPGPWLQEALDSVVDQTFADWDLVVVDDGSGHDLSWVSEVDARIRLLRVRHGGVSTARNLGIAATDGELVAFLDADDRWRPDKLARQVDALDGGEVFAHTAFDLIDPGGARIGGGWGRSVDYLDMLSGHFGILHSSVMVRRAALDEVGTFNPLLSHSEDLDLYLRLLRVGRAAFVDSVEVEYRLHGDNRSRDYWPAIGAVLSVFDLHELAALEALDRRAIDAIGAGRRGVRITYAHKAIDAARDALHGHRVTDALTAYVRAVKLSPRIAAQSPGRWLGRRLLASPTEDHRR